MAYTATHTATYHRPARRGFTLSTVLAAWRSRQALKALDDRALADIGLSRSEAHAEASRPIWDVPANWRG